MGFYLNPRFPLPHEGELTREEKIAYNNQKRGWLEENGVRLDRAPTWKDIPADCCAICCVENGIFQAAAVANKPSELEYFVNGMHGRPHTWFLIEKKIAVDNGNITMDDFA